MTTWTIDGTRCLPIEEPPPHDNDNMELSPPWRTPAETLQLIRRYRARTVRQLAADSRLWACRDHLLLRTIPLAMERCALWHFYGVR